MFYTFSSLPFYFNKHSVLFTLVGSLSMVTFAQTSSELSAQVPINTQNTQLWKHCPCTLQYQVFHRSTGLRLASYQEQVQLKDRILNVNSHFIPNPNIPLLPKEQLIRRSEIEPSLGALVYQEVRTKKQENTPLWKLRLERNGSQVHLEQKTLANANATSNPTASPLDTLEPSDSSEPLLVTKIDTTFSTQGLPLLDAQSIAYLFWIRPNWLTPSQEPRNVKLAWGNKNKIEPLSIQISYKQLPTFYRVAPDSNVRPSSAPFVIVKYVNTHNESVHIAFDPQWGVATTIWFNSDVSIYAQLVSVNTKDSIQKITLPSPQSLP